MEHNYQDREHYKIAKKRIKEIKSFYIHLTVYILVNTFLFFRKANFFNHSDINIDFENFTVPFFWGIGLAAHWISVFGPDFFLGKNWEEKKIQELMDKDKKQQQKWK